MCSGVKLNFRFHQSLTSCNITLPFLWVQSSGKYVQKNSLTGKWYRILAAPILQTGLKWLFQCLILFQLFAPHLSGFNPFPDSHKSMPTSLFLFLSTPLTINTTRWLSRLYLIHFSCEAGWDEVTASTGGLIRPHFPKYHLSKRVSFKDTKARTPRFKKRKKRKENFVWPLFFYPVLYKFYVVISLWLFSASLL